MNYQNLNDEMLLELLMTEEDRLQREAVDEIIRRGKMMILPLSDIVSRKYMMKEL